MLRRRWLAAGRAECAWCPPTQHGSHPDKRVECGPRWRWWWWWCCCCWCYCVSVWGGHPHEQPHEELNSVRDRGSRRWGQSRRCEEGLEGVWRGPHVRACPWGAWGAAASLTQPRWVVCGGAHATTASLPTTSPSVRRALLPCLPIPPGGSQAQGLEFFPRAWSFSAFKSSLQSLCNVLEYVFIRNRHSTACAPVPWGTSMLALSMPQLQLDYQRGGHFSTPQWQWGFVGLGIGVLNFKAGPCCCLGQEGRKGAHVR